LSHAARAERLIERLLDDGGQAQDQLMRDAFEETLVEREEFIDLVGRAPEDITPSPKNADINIGLPGKQDVMERLLQEGPVLIQLDARKEGVDVPKQFLHDARLVLRLGYGLSPPIHDLILDDDGVSATLTFSGVPYHCQVPWESVYAVVSAVSERRMVWPDDIPPEALADLGAQERAEDPPPRKAERRGGHLRLVK
jgi:stringent starvation protein B